MRTDLDPQPVATLVIAAFDGLRIQWLLDPGIDIESSRALFDRLLEAQTTKGRQSHGDPLKNVLLLGARERTHGLDFVSITGGVARGRRSHDYTFGSLWGGAAAGGVGGAAAVGGSGLRAVTTNVTVSAGRGGAGSAARFISNAAGDLLDTSKIVVPQGKTGYLLNSLGKTKVFNEILQFSDDGLVAALKTHLIDNFGSATKSVALDVVQGAKFNVSGSLAGPSGQVWRSMTTAWAADPGGVIRLITAIP